MIGSYLRKVWTLLWKDLVSESRTKELLNFGLVFSFLVLVVFNFAFDIRSGETSSLAAGVLWVTFVFAGVLSLGRAFARDKERGTMDGLLLAPVDRSAIYLAKVLANIVYMAAVQAVVLPVFAALFDIPFVTVDLLLIVALGTVGLASVGTLFAAIAAHARAREMMLPVLMFPIIVPVVIAAVKASDAALGDSSLDLPWINLLVAFDAVFFAVSLVVFEYVIEE